MKNKFDVLITDSRYKHSLAMIRNLGKEKLTIATCSEQFSPTIFSKYSKKSFRYTKQNFKEKLINFLKKNEVKLVIPVGYFSNLECSKIKKNILKYSNIVIEDYGKMEKFSNKEKIIPFLKKHNILFPKIYLEKDLNKLENFQNKKLIMKYSKEGIGEKITYINSIDELKNSLLELPNDCPKIFQEFIAGESRGFFAFCENGKILQSFQHKRIRQYPETGGVSSCAQSISDIKLNKISKSFINQIKWTGPIMLEYIYNFNTKKYYFIELNAKFWGSYDLSVTCGLNFAKIPFQIISGKKYFKKIYTIGDKFQWVLPEDTLRIRNSLNKKLAKKEWMKDLFDKTVDKDIRYFFNDPLPTLIRLCSTTWRYILNK